MVDWIEPLNLEKWFIQVFAGTPDIFLAIALLVISSMAGYFRMKGLALFFMIGVFLLMFSGFISSPFLVFLAIFGGLAIGYTLSRIFSQ